MATDDHNKGQTDRAAGNYDPPHSAGEVMVSTLNPFVLPREVREMEERNANYDAGWNNTDAQVKHKR
jgi:hypothetical protein